MGMVGAVTLMEKEQMDVSFVKTYFKHIVEIADENGDHEISKEEFEKLLITPGVAQALQSVSVDVVGLVDFIDWIFKGNMPLSVEKFMDIVLQLRGTNRATVRDIVDLRKLIVQECSNMRLEILHILDACKQQKKA